MDLVEKRCWGRNCRMVMLSCGNASTVRVSRALENSGLVCLGGLCLLTPQETVERVLHVWSHVPRA